MVRMRLEWREGLSMQGPDREALAAWGSLEDSRPLFPQAPKNKCGFCWPQAGLSGRSQEDGTGLPFNRRVVPGELASALTQHRSWLKCENNGPVPKEGREEQQ